VCTNSQHLSILTGTSECDPTRGLCAAVWVFLRGWFLIFSRQRLCISKEWPMSKISSLHHQIQDQWEYLLTFRLPASTLLHTKVILYCDAPLSMSTEPPWCAGGGRPGAHVCLSHSCHRRVTTQHALIPAAALTVKMTHAEFKWLFGWDPNKKPPSEDEHFYVSWTPIMTSLHLWYIICCSLYPSRNQTALTSLAWENKDYIESSPPRSVDTWSKKTASFYKRVFK
jgi:hypothetical protein